MRTPLLAGLLLLVAPLAPSPARAQALTYREVTPVPQALVGVPVGTIIPYVGPLDRLPRNWQPCDGRQVTDPASPFRGQRLPNLMNDRFLMGVAASQDVNREGGTNALPADGRHSHSIAFRGYAHGEINYSRGSGRQDQFQMQYGASAEGEHSHGGDNRPAYSGVYYIIRIK